MITSMTTADMATIGGYLIGSWAVGWGAGRIQRLFAQLMEKL